LLACGLCVLAFVFFIEAKTAWYDAASGSGITVTASKAMPADVPRVIEHGVPVPDPIHPQVPFALLAALTLPRPAADRPACDNGSRHRLRLSLAGFSSHLFFRPPPSLA